MAVVTKTADTRGVESVPGKGEGGNLKEVQKYVTVGSADSATSTYSLGLYPSNMRLTGSSKLHYDDLASSGSPTLDIGVFPVNSNITADDDALNDGIDAGASGGASVAMIKDKANYGKQLWEHVSGQSVDPGGLLEIKVTLKDADVNVGGDVHAEIIYTID